MASSLAQGQVCFEPHDELTPTVDQYGGYAQDPIILPTSDERPPGLTSWFADPLMAS